MAARGSGGIVGERKVDVAVKRQHEASCGDENVLCLDCITSHIPYCDNVLEFCKLLPLGDPGQRI